MKKMVFLITMTAYLFGFQINLQLITGEWVIEGYKPNQTIYFADYIGKKRNETLTLFFNRRGKVKVIETGKIYNYEITNGKLKVYKSRFYGNNHEVKERSRYNLLTFTPLPDGCYRMKTVVQKMPLSISRKEGVKICKTSNYPVATTQVSRERF